MGRENSLSKVACFATRTGVAGVELLVIRHPTAGTQIPAGTVEYLERPSDAALREFLEETGTEPLEAHELAATVVDLSPPNGVLLCGEVTSPPTYIGSGNKLQELRRGLPIKILEVTQQNTLMVYEELDYNVSPPKKIRSITSWVPNKCVSHEIVRYFFKITAASSHDRAQSWSINADGQRWELEWVPLDDKLKLLGQQQEWLESVIGQLI